MGLQYELDQDSHRVVVYLVFLFDLCSVLFAVDVGIAPYLRDDVDTSAMEYLLFLLAGLSAFYYHWHYLW